MDHKLVEAIKNWFELQKGTITAFSGGIDSALVLYLSRMYLDRDKAIGVISNSESLKNKDYRLAIDFAKENDIKLETIYTNELADTNYNTNPANRCYFCKSHLYKALEKVKMKYPDYTILNGTNKDDFSDYRPGMIAADENQIRSPLADLNLGKDDIRSLAKYFGIKFWDKPSSPCLSSRIPYGARVTANKLAQIENAEDVLNDFGFNNVRIRHYGRSCKIEVPLDEIDHLRKLSTKIIPLIKAVGFQECIIEEDGLISGKLNSMLNLQNG